MVLLALLAIISIANAEEDKIEIDFQKPIGIKEESLELNCRYRLPATSTLKEIYFILGEFSLDASDIIVKAEGTSGPRHWYGDWEQRAELEHNEDLDGWRVALLRIAAAALEYDQAKFTCGVNAEDILSLSEKAIVTAEVQVRPDDLVFQHEIKEKTLFVSCGAENGKPFASSSIMIDESLGRTISGDGVVNASYQLTPAFDGKAVTCSVTHPTYDDSSIVQDFKLGAPRPSSSCGQTQTEACETVESGELAIVAVEMTREGDECSFFVTSTSPTLQPPAKLRWEGPEENPSFEFESVVGASVNFTTSAFDNTTAISVVAESILGASAVAFVFREHCLPIPTTTAAVSPDDEAEMAGAIVAAIVLGSLAVVFIIAAAIYFTCFNKHEEAYRPNEKDSDLDDITSSVDLNEVAETKKTASVKRSKSGTWNVPSGEENASLLGPSNSLRSAPKRTTSTQTLPESEKYDQTVTLKENAVFASTESVHV